MKRLVIIMLWMVALGMSIPVDCMAQTDSVPTERGGVTMTEDVIDSIDMESLTDSATMLKGVSVKVRRPSVFVRALDGVTNFFMDCDTMYVTPQKYNLTAQMELSYWHDYYFMRSRKTGNTMVIQSDPSAILGGFVYYSIFGYGAVWNLNDIGIKAGKTNGTSLRQTFVIHTAKIFAEYYMFNSGKGAEIRSVSGISTRGKEKSFHGLDSRCKGFSAVYFFNNRHFSWPAAFGANAVQRKSCGSWSLGFQFNRQDIKFDKDELPDYIKEDIDSTLLFSHVNYKDYCVSVGYNYNCVLGRNVLFAASLIPNLGYRTSSITEPLDFKHLTINNLSTDVNLRLSLFWNNTRMFNGIIVEAHTYSYRKSTFGLTNTYGTVKYLMGVNFWKKPEYRKRKN